MGMPRQLDLLALLYSDPVREHTPPARPRRVVRLQTVDLPKSREACRGPGLCPKLSCKYNLTVDVTEAGSIAILGECDPASVRVKNGTMYEGKNHDGFDERVLAKLEMMEVNCALDIAEAGGLLSADLAALLGMTRFGVQLLIERAFCRLKNDPASRDVLRHLAGVDDDEG